MTRHFLATLLTLSLSGCATVAATPEQQRKRYLREHGNACSVSSYPGRAYTWLTPWQEGPESPETPYKQMIRDEVARNIGPVKDCYEDALDVWRQLEGRVRIRFVIDADGSVGRSEVLESTICPKEIGCCIANAVRQWRFPKPEGGLATAVTYPYVLEQTGAREPAELLAEPSKPTCVP